MDKPFAWSWSALDSFETCPRRHQLVKVVKAFPEKQNPQMLAGQQFHKALELRVERGKSLPPDMKQYEPIIQRLEKSAEGGTMVAERKIGLTRDLQECEYFDKAVWLRTVVDCQIDSGCGKKAMVLDWKTGKVKEGYDQLALTAAVKFAISPTLERASTAYVWFQANSITKENFVRDDVAGIWRNILPRVAKLENALATGKFPAKQSGLCRAHCPVTTCEHNGNFQG